MRQCRLAVRVCAVCLVALSISPVTFPFSTWHPAAPVTDDPPAGVLSVKPKLTPDAVAVALPPGYADAAPHLRLRAPDTVDAGGVRLPQRRFRILRI